ncbi:MAG: hypothetical protein Q4F40_01640 [Akkermansia sp.]|nr:hypothetical protein [Akkermansia sp.]MDO5463613.1 hypothetical protein [Akkermansia sp.]
MNATFRNGAIPTMGELLSYMPSGSSAMQYRQSPNPMQHNIPKAESK